MCAEATWRERETEGLLSAAFKVHCVCVGGWVSGWGVYFCAFLLPRVTFPLLGCLWMGVWAVRPRRYLSWKRWGNPTSRESMVGVWVSASCKAVVKYKVLLLTLHV